jgi:hypothetical protein
MDADIHRLTYECSRYRVPFSIFGETKTGNIMRIIRNFESIVLKAYSGSNIFPFCPHF